jgi:hypothetical protein
VRSVDGGNSSFSLVGFDGWEHRGSGVWVQGVGATARERCLRNFSAKLPCPGFRDTRESRHGAEVTPAALCCARSVDYDGVRTRDSELHTRRAAAKSPRRFRPLNLNPSTRYSRCFGKTGAPIIHSVMDSEQRGMRWALPLDSGAPVRLDNML